MLVETLSLVMARSPLGALAALAQIRRGRAAVKQALADHADLNVAGLPWNDQLIDLITAERARGRRVYLASASDRSVVELVAEQLSLFDGVFASDGRVNLKGQAKSAALCATFGERASSTRAMTTRISPVARRECDRSRRLVVCRRPGTVSLARARVIRAPRATVRTYLKAIRVHQWLKNILLLVPALAAHRLSLPLLGYCVIGFLSFSLCASSVYVTNDLVDLKRDRLHSTKRNRPFAAARSRAAWTCHGPRLAGCLRPAGVDLMAQIPAGAGGLLSCDNRLFSRPQAADDPGCRHAGLPLRTATDRGQRRGGRKASHPGWLRFPSSSSPAWRWSNGALS